MTQATALQSGCGSSLYRYEDLRIVHLELTHRCNAACPMCARNIYGGAQNPDMPLSELSLDDIKAILLPDCIGQLKRIYACGNYGDPIVARDCIEVFSYLREHGPQRMSELVTTFGEGFRSEIEETARDLTELGVTAFR